MSLLNTLVWWQWSLLALVPLGIILLYFLKLKRQPLEVPSTYLWSRTVEELQVNSIWQRLRRNLLLFLQLLLILLIALALLRPGWRGAELSGNRFVFALDNSASMSTRDAQPSRLEAAKRVAVRLVDQMDGGDVGMVIAFSDTAQVMQTFSESRRALRRRIQQIAPTGRPTDIHEALRAASGLANPNYTRLQDEQAVDEALPATLYLLSDGQFPALPDFSLGNLEPVYLPIGKPGTQNLGIVAFSTERNPERPDQLQAFARVYNSSDRPATVDLELFLDGQSVDVAELTVDGGQSGSWTFDLPNLEEAELQLNLSPADVLDFDNSAYATVNRPRPANVLLVTAGDKPLQLAMQTDEAVKFANTTVVAPSILQDTDQQHTEHLARAAAGEYDLIVYDQCTPQRMPSANTLFIDALPPAGQWQATHPAGGTDIIDIDRTHPLTQLVDMDYVRIATAMRLQPPPGSVTLMDAAIGPVCAVAPRSGFEDVVLGFAIVDARAANAAANTTWPLRPSFPVFVLNVLRYLGGIRGAADVTSISPGNSVSLKVPGYVDHVTVESPTGVRFPMDRLGQSSFVFTDTAELGIYRVFLENESEPVQRFAVNLLDQRESHIEPRPSLELGHDTIQGKSRLHAARREMWKWIVLACLGVLMIEWYVYNRRVAR